MKWIDNFRDLLDNARPQHGEASHYRRSRPADSSLDQEATLAEQFDLLRDVDNDRYPAFFEWRRRRYQLHVRPVATARGHAPTK